MEDKANIIRTSIRMDSRLHKKLSDYVNARKYGPDKTSIDAVVQEAVRQFFEGPAAKDRPISNELHRKVKTAAENLGMPLDLAYGEAINEWLSPAATPPGTPITCPPHLADIVRRAVVALNQPGVYERIIDNALKGVVKDFLEDATGEEDQKNGTDS